MVVTPGSNKKSKNKNGTPQGKGDATPQGAASVKKTPQSQKGQSVTPKLQKGQMQTPGSHKSGGATPQSQKGQSITPKSQKGQIRTPGSQKLSSASPKFSRDSSQTQQSAKVSPKTPKSEKGKAATTKMQKGHTPQSHSGKKQNVSKMEHQQKFETPNSEVTAATPLMKKSPKNMQQLQSSAGSSQKAKTPSQPTPKAGSTTAKLQDSNKKRKLDADESSNDSSSYDSAEENFEALIGHPKKSKTEGTSPSPKKLATAMSPSKQVSGKQDTDTDDADSEEEDDDNDYDSDDDETLPAKKQQPVIAGMTRSLDSDESDSEDDDDDDDDDDDVETLAVKKQQPVVKGRQQLTPRSSSGTASAEKQQEPTLVSSKVAKMGKQSEDKLAAGMKRSLESDESDSEVDENDDDDDDEIQPLKKQKPASEAVAAKKSKMEPKTEVTSARQTSPIKAAAATVTEADAARDMKRQEALDRRLLYVKNIPKSATEAQVKALHDGIVNVQLRALKWSHKAKRQYQFAHLEFKDEKSAIDAHKVLSARSMGDRALAVDYFGAKSNNPTTKKPFTADQLDPCKLFISRYPLDTTAEELKVLFPTAASVELLAKQQGQPIGFAFVHFTNADACRKAHEQSDSLKVRGRTIMVVFARRMVDKPSSQQHISDKPLPKPTVGKVAQQTNVAVVKGQQQKTAMLKKPDTSALGASPAKPSAGRRLAAAAADEQDDDSDEDDEDEDDLDEDDDDDSDSDDSGDDDSFDDDDDDDDE